MMPLSKMRQMQETLRRQYKPSSLIKISKNFLWHSVNLQNSRKPSPKRVTQEKAPKVQNFLQTCQTFQNLSKYHKLPAQTLHKPLMEPNTLQNQISKILSLLKKESPSKPHLNVPKDILVTTSMCLQIQQKHQNFAKQFLR